MNDDEAFNQLVESYSKKVDALKNTYTVVQTT